jgi:hypothetical protein
VVALVFIIAVIGAAQTDVSVAIEAMYRRAETAAIAARTLADLDVIRGWLDTADCVYAEFGQPPRSWADMRSYAREGLRTPITALHNTIQELDIHGDTATATTVVTGVAHVIDVDGRFGAKGAAHEIETVATARDVWVRTSDGWRRQAHIKTVPNRMTAVDGKRLK